MQDFTNRKRILCHTLCLLLVISLWLSGSNGMARFKIFRSERDVFAKCRQDGSCEELNCAKYGAECVESNSEYCYCRCTKDRNTFMHIGKAAKCKNDKDVEPKSAAHEKRFSLQNSTELNSSACLKVESGSSNFVIGEGCASRDIDMFWRWTTTGDKKLMNVKTLQCMQENPDGDGGKVIMTQCKKESELQRIFCNKSPKWDGMRIRWNTLNTKKYLYLSTTSLGTKKYAISKKSANAHRWLSETNSCKPSPAYTGCYRFSDGSFMAYLKYDITDIKLHISAPIFEENHICSVESKFQSLRMGDLEWKENTDRRLFSDLKKINGTIKELQVIDAAKLRTFNGTLLKLKVVCGRDNRKKDEEHCVLLKLESSSKYSDFRTSSPTSPKTTSTKDVNTTTIPSAPITINKQIGTQSSSSRSPSSANSKTQKPDEGLESTSSESSEPLSPTISRLQKTEEGLTEASESDETNSVAIAVPVILLFLLALALALGYLVYYRRRKRAQMPQDNHEDTRAVNNSKGRLYEDPDRLYETLRENGQEEPSNQPGATSHIYNYADNTVVASPALSEQEYTYAKDTDMPRITRDTKTTPVESTGSPEYHTLEPEQHIANEASADLEYTYAKDTDLSKATPNTKAKPEGPTSSPVYHTLEQEQPNSEGLYNYIDDNDIAKPGSTDLEYTYAKDTDLPRVIPNTKASPEGTPATSDAVYHTLEQEGPTPSEPEYSYAKNTDIPLIPVGMQQTPQGISAPPTDSVLYYTLVIR